MPINSLNNNLFEINANFSFKFSIFTERLCWSQNYLVFNTNLKGFEPVLRKFKLKKFTNIQMMNEMLL
jgi:hypothetical protein